MASWSSWLTMSQRWLRRSCSDLYSPSQHTEEPSSYTSNSYHRRTHTTRCFKRILLHTDVDAQYDKLAKVEQVSILPTYRLSSTNGGRYIVYHTECLPLSIKLTTRYDDRHAVVNVLSSEFAVKIQKQVGLPLFRRYSSFLMKQCRAGWRKPKTSSIRPGVRLVTDRHRQTLNDG